MISNSYRPIITKPTRITDTSTTLIDHIWINDMDNGKLQSNILITDITDHLPIIYIKQTERNTQGFTNVKYRQLNDKTKSIFKQKLQEMDEKLMSYTTCNQSNANEKAANYFTHFSKLYNECFPIKVKKIHNKTLTKPWIDQEMQRLIKKKNRLYGEKLKYNTKASIVKYNQCKKALKKKLKSTKMEYFKNKLLTTTHNMKKKWDTIRLIINKKKNRSTYAPIQSELLGNHYSTVAEKLNRKLKLLNKHDIASSSAAVDGSMPNSRFCFSEIDVNDVYEMILKLNNSKGPGPDDFNVKVLKYVSDIIAPHITNLFNCCIKEGTYIDSFKIAKCVAVYKGNKADVYDPVSYRPISILNSLNKVFEKLLHNQLYCYLEHNKLLPQFQYGYRKGHSPCHAVLDFTKEIENTLDNNEVAVAVFMDLSKAFDTVDKTILKEKLNKLGIAGISNRLLYNYMTNRHFCMTTEPTKMYEMNYGVPQGSILGPLLFLIYIYDMKYIAPLIKSIVYADDTTIIVTGRTVTEAMQRTNAILDRYYHYFTVNKLTLNESKTKYMIYCKKRKSGRNVSNTNIVMNNVILDKVRSIKFLGVYINDQLNWNDHKRYIVNKISRNLGILYKCRNIMETSDLVSMYNSFILPYFLYCMPLLGGSVTNNNDIIKKMQDKALRILFDTRRTDDAWRHSNNLIIPINELYKIEISKLCYKHLNNDLPEYFSQKIMPNFADEIHNMSTRHRTLHNYNLLKENITPLSYNSFTTQCIRIWNSIPLELKKQIDSYDFSLPKFTKKLKDYTIKYGL